MTARLGVRRATAVRAAAVTAVAILGVWVWLGWSMTKAGDDPATVGAVASVLVFVGLPFAIAAAATAWHIALATHGPDGPARVLALATAGRHDGRDEWGAAMRAELASIKDARERSRFALGCVLAALRTGWGRGPSLTAAGGFAGFAAITLVASRTMLANDRTGILAAILVSVPILLATGLIAARAGRSFRTGLECGLVALLASLAGILVVTLPEAVTWYRTAGIWILDGDSPPHGIAGPDEAVRDALSGVTFFYLIFGTPWPVIGAALGAWRRGQPSTTSAASQPRSGRRLPGIWSRYRGVKTQNSLPSGSAITTQLTSPWPMSIRVAPRETRRLTSAC